MAEVIVGDDAVAAHNVPVGTTESTDITFGRQYVKVEIISDGTAAIYYTLDTTDPEVDGERCYVLPAGVMSVDERSIDQTIRFIATAPTTVTVQRQ